ncbi:MAG: amidohydrolase family protein [Candidatus Hydrogenedentes bacterium]|nr:amidohydrolase family protein [Candidatus Hydrogenedentota bacterium]
MTRSFTVRGVILGHEHPSDIHVEDGRIVSIGPVGIAKADFGSRASIIGPTLFDIQVNGMAGINLQGRAVVPEDIGRISGHLAHGGVSHWVPTLITGSQEDLEHGCRVIAVAMHDPKVARAVPGVHLEGPYISAMDGPRGAHPRKHVRLPSVREFDRLLKAADGRIAYVTVAPELDGAIPFIKAVVKRGVVVSLGHHNGVADDVARAVDAGARMCTHLGNGLATQLKRHENPLWPQLAEDRLVASLIADLAHLPAPVLKTFVRAKGCERVVLTSDCVHITGMKPGRYTLSGHDVELTRNGRILLSGTELLAGSALMLLQGVVNAAQVTDMTLEQAYACATTIPAALLGLDAEFGPPEVGEKAEFVVFDIDKTKAQWKANVRGVFVDGVAHV